MAREASVTEKTIRRDLDTFRGVGFALEDTIGEFGRKTWRIKGTGNQPLLGFDFEEATALYLGRRLLEPLSGTMFWNAAQRAFNKIRAAFGDDVLDYVDRFSTLFHHATPGVSDYAAKATLIDDLITAVEDGKAAHILYQSERATEPAFRDVHPYGVIFYKAWLYLIAFDPQDDRVKHYKVDRIESVEISPIPFRRPEGFSLAAHLSSTFGVYQGDGEPTTVKVRFALAVARYVLESKWPGCREATKQRDGGVLAEFRLDGTKELKSWLLSFGAKAVVLEPENFRREIAGELKSLLAAYESPLSQLESVCDDPTDSKNPSRIKPARRK